MTGSGDSGGPIFFNGKLTAVVAFGGVGLGYGESKNDDLIYEYDTNLLNGEAQHILRRAISEIGAKITGLQ